MLCVQKTVCLLPLPHLILPLLVITRWRRKQLLPLTKQIRTCVVRTDVIPTTSGRLALLTTKPTLDRWTILRNRPSCLPIPFYPGTKASTLSFPLRTVRGRNSFTPVTLDLGMQGATLRATNKIPPVPTPIPRRLQLPRKDTKKTDESGKK